ncbi:hypothetical protein HNO89_002811 [Sporosarcina luteola]|nr:hypothetical protein [Sporosarcina luteola]
MEKIVYFLQFERGEVEIIRWVAVIVSLAVLSIFILTHFLAIYPGGYSLEKQNGEVLIEKGSDIKRATINNSVYNELKIASLESRIKDLKTLWYVGVLFTATTLLTIITFKKLKMKKAIIITASVYVVLAVLYVPRYASTISLIENAIGKL